MNEDYTWQTSEAGAFVWGGAEASLWTVVIVRPSPQSQFMKSLTWGASQGGFENQMSGHVGCSDIVRVRYGKHMFFGYHARAIIYFRGIGVLPPKCHDPGYSVWAKGKP